MIIICFVVIGKKMKNYHENHYMNNKSKDALPSTRYENDVQLEKMINN